MQAFYDLKRCPPSFDIVSFAMRAELERIRRGDASIEMHILPGPVGGFRADNLWPPTIAEREHMRENVVVPMLWMLPSVGDVTTHTARPLQASHLDFGFDEYSMHFSHFVAAMAQGVRPLRPSELPRNRKLITITLREAVHWPERNSHFSQWLVVARCLELEGLEVVFVRDTHCADWPIDGHACDPEASRSLDRRGALYRSAACNLFVSNGPAWFAIACDAPALVFRPACEALGACYGNDFWKSCGVKPGLQIPGTPAHQHLFWCEDNAADVLAATRDFMARSS